MRCSRNNALRVTVLLLGHYALAMLVWQFSLTKYHHSLSISSSAGDEVRSNFAVSNSTLPITAANFNATSNGTVGKQWPRNDSESSIIPQKPGADQKPSPSVANDDDAFMKNYTFKRKEVTFLIEPRLDRPGGALTYSDTDLNCRNIQPGQHQTRWSLVIFVKSKASYGDRRRRIRGTWGKYLIIGGVRMEKIFVVGVTEDQEQMRKITEESTNYGDILQYGGPDDYRNMPVKITSAMQWASHNLPPDVIYASTDDDFMVNYEQALALIEAKMRSLDKLDGRNFTGALISSPILCIYYFGNNGKPERNPGNKYYVSVDEYPASKYPLYCGGGFYTMPVSLLGELFELSRVTQSLPMDDVWITGLLRSKLGRGDSNIDVVQPQPVPRAKTVWVHMWGDYGKMKKNVPAMLSKSWKNWEAKLVNSPFCIR